MKKLTIIIAVLSIILSSCGDSNSKAKDSVNEKANTVVKKKEIKTIEQRKEAGIAVRAELNKYLKEIPENLVFKESLVNAMGIKKTVFVAENVDAETKIQLDNWVIEESEKLVKANWEKILLQDRVMVSGMEYNSYSFKKAQGGESTATDMLSLTSVHSPDKETFSIFIKPYSL